MMHRTLGHLAAAALTLAFASLAAAQSAPTPAPATLPVKNGNGVIGNVAGQTDSAGNFHYRDVLEGLDPLGNPQGWYVDSQRLGHVSVDNQHGVDNTNPVSSTNPLPAVDAQVNNAVGSAAAQAHDDAGGAIASAAAIEAQAHSDALTTQAALNLFNSALSPYTSGALADLGSTPLITNASVTGAFQLIAAGTYTLSCSSATVNGTITSLEYVDPTYGSVLDTVPSSLNANGSIGGIILPATYVRAVITNGPPFQETCNLIQNS